ncbi:uncharacterized protein [Clytia hemisphaerica]|uniref:Uncharacterized protein n=1 Tax=Clytia hemisphaerica TaxID=252671 RepID=A0A7M5UZ50_9CNID|eukprot:TCONS_00041425-protein
MMANNTSYFADDIDQEDLEQIENSPGMTRHGMTLHKTPLSFTKPIDRNEKTPLNKPNTDRNETTPAASPNDSDDDFDKSLKQRNSFKIPKRPQPTITNQPDYKDKYKHHAIKTIDHTLQFNFLKDKQTKQEVPNGCKPTINTRSILNDELKRRWDANLLRAGSIARDILIEHHEFWRNHHTSKRKNAKQHLQPTTIEALNNAAHEEYHTRKRNRDENNENKEYRPRKEKQQRLLENTGNKEYRPRKEKQQRLLENTGNKEYRPRQRPQKLQKN